MKLVSIKDVGTDRNDYDTLSARNATSFFITQKKRNSFCCIQLLKVRFFTKA